MRKLFLSFLIFVFSLPAVGQELLVRRFDSNYNEVSIDTFMLGDLIIIGHAKKGKNPHYFQGKITGIFKDRGVIRVFDYARSTRFMPIAGKKIPVDNIIAVGRPDEKKMKGRETRAIAATAGQFLGSAVGGDAGDVIFWTSTAGNVVSDFVSREKLKTERIKCEIFEF
ncbi:hypothetical protein [Lutimonas zeaxanthinifaciens]|uniref:hypothetical protein n=1 Tax=Lutimonas zeaxanthinifaciens TaxID=3060215 RepID=UPI00265D4EF7|nr:hypothetical protein [Lutimonas sp. YSD2104]WKK65155.1 hypothetical protein QZH61_11250 [Lutimonas sp. YSD2104]